MTTILLIQFFKEPPLGISSLEVALSQRFGSQLVALDSFSDGSNLAYVRKMIEESEKINAIIWENEGGTLKGVQPIFNALLKKKQVVSLITNSSQGVIAKMCKAMESKKVEGETELIEVVKTMN
ncbi:MAG: hypothetical protein R8G66_28930 [Cytophagales bacterium]|nr:hypothetical protein [Cytophagales bacterium]